MQYLVHYTIPGERTMFPLTIWVEADSPSKANDIFKKEHPLWTLQNITIPDDQEGKLIRVFPEPF